MKSIRDEECCSDLVRRIEALTPEASASWGKMSVEQMLSHLVQANELPFVASVPDRSTFMSRNAIRPLVLYVMPIPKEVQTSAEMDQQQKGRPPKGFDSDRAALIESLHRLGSLQPKHECLPHPFFGPMSAKQWGLLAYKHIDHHLRQFGV